MKLSLDDDRYNFKDFQIFPRDENLNTGHRSIDQQHLRLVDMLNKL